MSRKEYLLCESEPSVEPSVAIVGATGAVGVLLRQVLEERKFPAKSVKFLASARSAGQRLAFQGHYHTVEPLVPEAFVGVNIVLSSTPAAISPASPAVGRSALTS